MKLGAIAIAAALILAGCGGSHEDDGTRATTAATATAATDTGGGDTRVTGKLPTGAEGPVDTAEEAAEGPAATEASPEASAVGPSSTGGLEGADRSAATEAVRDYIEALDRHHAARVCALIAPGGVDLGDLPGDEAAAVHRFAPRSVPRRGTAVRRGGAPGSSRSSRRRWETTARGSRPPSPTGSPIASTFRSRTT